MNPGVHAVSEVSMKRRFGLMMIIILAMMAWMGSALAAPKHLPSITDKVKNPGRVAIDSQGNLYVSEPHKNLLQIYNSKGVTIALSAYPACLPWLSTRPAGSLRRSEEKKAVLVYSPDLSFSHYLGSGSGEVDGPNATPSTEAAGLTLSTSAAIRKGHRGDRPVCLQLRRQRSRRRFIYHSAGHSD